MLCYDPTETRLTGQCTRSDKGTLISADVIATAEQPFCDTFARNIKKKKNAILVSMACSVLHSAFVKPYLGPPQRPAEELKLMGRED